MYSTPMPLPQLLRHAGSSGEPPNPAFDSPSVRRMKQVVGGPLGDWGEGRNDLEAPAKALVPEIGVVFDWLSEQHAASFVRMSGSGPTCFAFFNSEAARDAAANAVPSEWWHLATFLR